MSAEVWSAPTLFLACLVSGILVPVPEDVALLVAGWQMHEGGLPVVSGALAGFFGTFARDTLAFSAGRMALAGIHRTTFLARWLDTWRSGGVRQVSFYIGDADGFTAEDRDGAERLLALSRLTLPHRLARLILLEQLYRAATLLAGHPYHHD